MSSFRWGIIACITQRNSQVTGKNKEGWYQTPGRHQNMIIKYLSVGLWSWFSYQQVALNVLFQMRYESIPNSNKQPSDSLKAEATPVFTSNLDCFAYCFAQWCSPGVCRHASSFWSVTLQPLGVDWATIYQLKGDIHCFHMRYDSMPYSKNQPSDRKNAETPLVFTPLRHCFAYCSVHWCSPGVCMHHSPFWSVAQ